MHSRYIELVKLQKEIISSNLRVLVILEGRDAAGKDGTIKTITKHLSPRETKVVALGKPSEKQDHEWYFQRYVTHLPAAGQIVLFNRSYYNRAGVEKVMGFCTDKEYKSFFTEVALFEKLLVEESFIILKYYLDISRKEQKRRLDDRKENPLKLWKRSCHCRGKNGRSEKGERIYENTGMHAHGDEPCSNEFETSYAPDRPEIVYCEKCYQQEVY